jgi:hypothetical protein
MKKYTSIQKVVLIIIVLRVPELKQNITSKKQEDQVPVVSQKS